MEIGRTTVTANGLEFAALECGAAEAPLALCLHGFPDSAYTWRYLLPQLADAGFHAVAPWLRGYAPSALAADGDYSLAALAADTNALHDALGGGSDAVLIGHDWGAMTAYGAGALRPDAWRRLVTIAVPPPAVTMTAFMNYRQIKRSFYIFVFQTALAEMLVGADDLAFVANLWADWSPGYDATEDVQHVRDALGDPANLAAAIGYYRAMLGGGGSFTESPPQPTLYLHGDADGCFGVEGLAGTAEALSPGSRAETLPGVGHFLHVERPDEVNRLILDWLAS